MNNAEGIPDHVRAEVVRCRHCGTESIIIGTAGGCDNTACPKGCPGWFITVRVYPLATGLDGIRAAFDGTAEGDAP